DYHHAEIILSMLELILSYLIIAAKIFFGVGSIAVILILLNVNDPSIDEESEEYDTTLYEEEEIFR
ncbi:MAG: hypothetical protein WCP55_10810, partial [Lentisphaerota bacterium]